MKIICVGRNYRAHAQELNNPVPTKPLIFMKPDTSLLRNNRDFYYPEFTKNLHYECEVVVRISREGKYLQEKFVSSYIDGVGLGIDFTARDIQDECKAKGLPWTLAKGFNDAAPVSEMIAPEELPPLDQLHFTCSVNGEQRQDGHTDRMIFPVGTLIAYISQFITVKKGDLIFTGTPAGVGPVAVNDHIEAELEGKKLLDFWIK